MPTSKAIAEETAFLQDMCRRLHCVVLLPCEHGFERPRNAPGKEEVLHDVDRAERRESRLDVLSHESLEGLSLIHI